MDHSFSHPAAAGLLKRVAHDLANQDLFLVPDHHLLFVCGGPVDSEKTFFRKIFLEHVKDIPNKKYRVFLAEDAAKTVTRHNEYFLDLSGFETFLASIADCILLFTESPGSFAELGMFSASPQTAEKCLVVLDIEYQAHDSFINNGPINSINEKSKYKSCLYLPLDNPNSALKAILKRLDRFNTKYRKQFKSTQFSEMNNKERVALIYEVARLFKALSVKELLYVVQFIYSFSEESIMEKYISLLVSSYYLNMSSNEHDILVPNGNHKLVSLDEDAASRISIDVLDYYRQHVPERYSFISELRR